MKYLIIGLLFSMNAYAEEKCVISTSQEEVVEQLEIKTDVPKFLEGATIIVRLADGRESTVPAEKFKVVPRKQQFITTLLKQKESKECSEYNKHRVSVLAGRGAQSGLRRDNSQAPNKVEVESKLGTVVGLQYQYTTDQKVFGLPFSLGAQALDNKSVLGVVGLDF